MVEKCIFFGPTQNKQKTKIKVRFCSRVAQKHKFGEKKFFKNMFFGKKSKILGLLGFRWDSAGIYVPAAGILQVSQQNPSISIPARTGPLTVHSV